MSYGGAADEEGECGEAEVLLEVACGAVDHQIVERVPPPTRKVK